MRVLVISNNALSSVLNNGKTVSSFLRNLDSENVANLYFGTNELPDIKNFKYYYRITELDIFKSISSFSFAAKNTHSTLCKSLISTNFSSKKKESMMLSFIKRHGATFAVFRELLWRLNTWKTKELYRWISDFRPDVIFSILGNSLFTHVISRTISNDFNLPLNVYFTDDYVLNDRSSNFFQKIHFRNTQKEYYKTLSQAKKAFVIGSKMKLEYERVFRRKFGVLVNGIDLKKFSQIKPKSFSFNDKTFIISYIGGLHLNRWKSISFIAKLANQIKDLRVVFKVYSVSVPSAEILNSFKESGVIFGGSLDSDGVFNELIDSHCLLHAESFDENYRVYTKYSISTKIPEYVACRRGIIAIGPSDVASIEFFKRFNIGCVITESDNEDSIKCKLLQYVMHYNDIEFDYQFKIAEKYFDQEKMQLNNLL